MSGVAIAGIGVTEFSRDAGRGPLALAADAARIALADAGLDASAVDGVLTYHRNDSCTPHELAEALAIDGLRVNHELLQGGPGCVISIGTAMSLIETGQASAVICYRALNGRSGKRIGQWGAEAPNPLYAWLRETGFLGVPVWWASWAQAYFDRFGLAHDALWPIAQQSRAHASRNPAALMRDELTYEDYVGARWIAEPLRLLDCCLETDAGCAIVLTDEATAAGTRKPVWMRAWGTLDPFGSSFPYDLWQDVGETGLRRLAPSVLARAGTAIDDIDYFQLYDNTTFSVCLQVDDLGLCAPGEAAAMIAEQGMGPDSPHPINTNGGLLSEGHVHGLSGVAEAVRQLRGEADGRQVPDCGQAVIVGHGGPRSSMAVLGAGR